MNNYPAMPACKVNKFLRNKVAFLGKHQGLTNRCKIACPSLSTKSGTEDINVHLPLQIRPLVKAA